MSGGQSRRLPRAARATPHARTTIEREKIRHRRPNDLMFDQEDQPAAEQFDQSGEFEAGLDHDESEYSDDDLDWTVEETGSADTPIWDEESEDDWVLDRDDDQRPLALDQDSDVELDEDDGGIVWEEDRLLEQESADRSDEVAFDPDEVTLDTDNIVFDSDETTFDSDDVAFDTDDVAVERGRKEFGFAPEVELAGRRDVRPKPPRSAPPPSRPRGRSQPQRPQQQRGQQQNHRRQGYWTAGAAADADDDIHEPGRGETPIARRGAAGPSAAARSHAPSDQHERFSRTRAPLGGPAGMHAGGSNEEVLHQPMHGPAPKRRQAQLAPTVPTAPIVQAARQGRRGGSSKGLIIAVVLALLAGVGWFAHQAYGADGIRSMLDRLVQLVPLSGSTRTATDTSFSDAGTGDAVSAEKAIADLEQRIKQQNGGEIAAGQAASEIDPATIVVDGPPIPKFKPPLQTTRSLAAEGPIPEIDQAQVAADDNDTGGNAEASEPSIFEQLWRYLNPS